MLLNLIITNFAIIDRLEVEFREGFNVLTGETGAGKSIVLDAIGLLLGDRARPELVRSGAEEATVEGLFQIEGLFEVSQSLSEAGLPDATADHMVLRRIIQSSGRSRAYINGSLVTLAQLQPVAEKLISVCGQHEHQALMLRGAHLPLLDHFGEHAPLVTSYKEHYQRMQDVRQHLESLYDTEQSRLQKLDYLRHQSLEIESANLTAGEEEDLIAERRLLQNAERLTAVTQQGYDVLYAADGAVCEQVGRLADELGDMRGVDAELGALGDLLRKTVFDIEDAASQLRQYLGRVNFEPERQDSVERRLAELSKLKNKYASSIEEIIQQKKDLDQEIHILENTTQMKDDLERQLKNLMALVQQAGEKLSQARAAAADEMAEKMGLELADLAMPGARFAVKLEELPVPGPEGLEKAEFKVSANPGEPLMPLSKVVSGGELSRLMLALKRIAPGADSVPTLIFDEVDAGIGGETASAVGRKLRTVSSSNQVLCVTHLPQVAAFADQHYRVFKKELDGRTLADVQCLTKEQRVQEMARMLGGAQISEKTLLHARELIESSAVHV